MQSFYNEAQIEVDGETLHFVLNFQAIDVIESLAGESFDDIIPQLIDGKTSLLTKFVWAILRENHIGMTLDQAAFIVRDEKHGPAVALVIGDLLRRAGCIGEPEAAEKKPNPPKRRGTSKTSSKNGLQPALAQ